MKKKLSASLLNIPTFAIKTLMLVDEYRTVISVTEFARLIGVFSFPVNKGHNTFQNSSIFMKLSNC